MNSLEEKDKKLNELKTKYERILKNYQNDLEGAVLLGDKGKIEQSEEGIIKVTKLLVQVAKDINGLNPQPLCEAVLFESEKILGELQAQASAQWDKCSEIRKQYLQELEKLGSLRKQSVNISHQTSDVMLKLRKNPLNPISFGYTKSQFIVDRDEINRLL
jgi:hypothetical protein